MSITTINPATGEKLNTYEEFSAAAVNTCIEAAQQSFLHWRHVDMTKRSHLMKSLAKNIRAGVDDFAELITQEMGKPIKLSIAEIEKCASVCEHYALHAKDYLKSQIVKTDYHKSYVSFAPLGVIYSIVPWNFPFWQVFRFAVPALMAGNTIVMKHAPVTTGCGILIEKIIKEAGFPPNVFRSIVLSDSKASSPIENPLISGVTLTGSNRAGKAVAELAGRHLKKVVLELGGSDPYLILEDANIEKAAELCVASRLSNSGQVCIAAKRLIVVESIASDFTEQVLKQIKHYRMGDPLQEGVKMGPIARADLRETIHKQVKLSVSKGAELVVGGEIPTGEGFFYPPTLLTRVTPGMPAFDEEIFGPVIAIIEAQDEQHAIKLANQTQFGLGAAIFSADIERAGKIAEHELEAGCCFVNHFVASDPRLPFGGIKQSGFGRELSSFGIHEFMNVKTVCINQG